MIDERLVRGGDAAVNLASGPKSGSPLLFLHGVGRCWQDFQPLMAVLGWRWQVHGLDFRGHGLSERTPGKYLVRDYVRDAVAVVRDHIADPVLIYGHSLGSLVTLAAAAELGDRVRGVVLEDPPLDSLGQSVKQTVFYSVFQILRRYSGSSLSVGEIARGMADSEVVFPGEAKTMKFGALRDGPSLRFMAACLKRVDPTVWDELLEGNWLLDYDPWALMPKLRCPVLLLHGLVADGSAISDASARRAESLLANCSRECVPGAGHLIHSLQGELTVRLVSDFLESIEMATGA